MESLTSTHKHLSRSTIAQLPDLLANNAYLAIQNSRSAYYPDTCPQVPKEDCLLTLNEQMNNTYSIKAYNETGEENLSTQSYD
jgi:hypothetical protein